LFNFVFAEAIIFNFMKFLPSILLTLIIHIGLRAQDVELLHIDNHLYPKIRLLMRFPDNVITDSIILKENNKKIRFKLSSEKNKHKLFVFYIVDLPSFTEDLQKNIFTALKINSKSINDGVYLNIGFVGQNKNCLIILNFNFTKFSTDFIDFAQRKAEYLSLQKEDDGYIRCAIIQAKEFISLKKAQDADYKIVVLTNKYDPGFINIVQEIKKQTGWLDFKFIVPLYDTLVNKNNELYFVHDFSNQKELSKAIFLASENKDLTNLSSFRNYLIEFTVNSKFNYTNVELRYFDEYLNIGIEKPEVERFLPEYYYWIIIAVLIVVIFFSRKKLYLSQKEIVRLKETVSLLFDKKLKILGKQTENPVIEVKLENDFKNYHLKKLTTTIGRDKSCDIVIKDMTVSSHHATITNEGGQFFITDNESTNGVFVNDLRIDKKNVKPGDIIRLGKAILTLHY